MALRTAIFRPPHHLSVTKFKINKRGSGKMFINTWGAILASLAVLLALGLFGIYRKSRSQKDDDTLNYDIASTDVPDTKKRGEDFGIAKTHPFHSK